MANSNIINAVFGSGICAVTTSAFRANYGMVLRFSGIDLPTAFEVDFSNYDVAGRDSVTAIGQNGEVQIPDDLWDSGLNIYAYVYLHPTDDSGVTVYTVTIPVLGRPNRTDETPTPHEQTVIEQAISALNEAVEQTAADVETTTANAQAAAQSEANALAYSNAASASAGAALASQNAAESAQQGATVSASASDESARNAANSASQAAQSATAAQASAEQAERSVQSIGDDVERAERAATTATDKATEAASSAATASTKAAQAEQSATAAAQSASSAASAAQNAAESEQSAQSSATDANTAKQDAQAAQTAAEQAAESVSGLSAQIAQNTADIADLQEYAGIKRYGVSGIGQQASALTRIWDSVGMTAQVGTDGDNTNIVNDFDHAAPFNRRKCVGYWYKNGNRAAFRVMAYKGDADYAEDGSMGDYVAVECPRAYYINENGVLGVSAHQYEGWRPFDIFCHDHNPNDTMPFAYIPAYALALKDGHAVSLPGLYNEQGAYKTLLDAARTYNNDDIKDTAILSPAALVFYEWALCTVEFAKQDPKGTMRGCISLRSSNDDTVTFVDATHVLTNNYYAARVAGEYIRLYTGTAGHTNIGYSTHKIVSVTRCDASGNADASGTHQLLEVEDVGATAFVWDTETTYNLAPRPYWTGSCNDVSTPSGSPVSNTDGYHPFKYRWRENLWGNQYHTLVDLFDLRVGTGADDYYLEWYYLLDPSSFTSKNPDATDLASDAFKKVMVTPHENYADGYIKSRQYSTEFPDIWSPDVTTGASNTTYFAVYAHLVSSIVVRSVRFGATWYYGHVYLNAIYAPAAAYASAGGDLCFAQ